MRLIVLVSVFWAWTLHATAKNCTIDKNTVVMIVLEGFKPEFVTKETKHLYQLKEESLTAEYMIPTFPTTPFATLFSMFTGNYSENTGLPDKKFYNLTLDEEFDYGKNGKDSKWYELIEPIWNVVTKNKKISAVALCPGGNIKINDTLPNLFAGHEDIGMKGIGRFEKITEWLKMQQKERPDFILMCSDQPLATIKFQNSQSPAISNTLKRLDDSIGMLLEVIEEEELCINLMIVSNFGATSDSENKIVKLKKLSPDITGKTSHIYTNGGVARINITDNEQEVDILNSINNDQNQCVDEESSCLEARNKDDLPRHCHFSKHENIDQIILTVRPNYAIVLDDSDAPKGKHGRFGYDNYLPEVRAFFLASGPAFKTGEIEPFEMVNLYNLICDILDLPAPPNDGQKEALYHILNTPPDYLPLEENTREHAYAVPRKEADIEAVFTEAKCPNNPLSVAEAIPFFKSLYIHRKERSPLIKEHFPLGIPAAVNVKDIYLLLHQDHVRAFSKHHKSSLFISFTTNGQAVGVDEPSEWIPDARVAARKTPKCSTFKTYAKSGLIMVPFFRPEHSHSKALIQYAYMTTNAFAMTEEANRRWIELNNMILEWGKVYSPMNVVIGIAHEKSTKSHWNKIPSAHFAILTKCKTQGKHLKKCAEAELENMAFLYPNRVVIPRKVDAKEYATSNLCTINDIERLTKLTFNNGLKDVKHAVRLAAKISTSIWDLQME